MNAASIRRASLFVMALGLAWNALAAPHAIRDINICRGMGQTCYCTGACVATHDGCECR
jgi:hypothetical protein